MKLKAILLDLNGTLIQIRTDESWGEIYRVMANFLEYYGMVIAPDALQNSIFEANRQQRKRSAERYSEFDVVKIFRNLLKHHKEVCLKRRKIENLDFLAEALAKLFRAASRFQLLLYPETLTVLDQLKKRFRLGVVSDGQRIWAEPEWRKVGLEGYFNTILVSSDCGYRKPDVRLFQQAMTNLDVTSEETIFVGNDMFRDIKGAADCGLRTIFFRSDQGDHAFAGAEPDYKIDRIARLPEAVNFLEQKFFDSQT